MKQIFAAVWFYQTVLTGSARSGVAVQSLLLIFLFLNHEIIMTLLFTVVVAFTLLTPSWQLRYPAGRLAATGSCCSFMMTLPPSLSRGSQAEPTEGKDTAVHLLSSTFKQPCMRWQMSIWLFAGLENTKTLSGSWCAQLAAYQESPPRLSSCCCCRSWRDRRWREGDVSHAAE